MHTLEIIREATEAGRNAYLNGQSIYDCPHSPMTENLQVIAWEKGWREQQGNQK